ncbi:MAG: coenzyme F420-0:L-glutamate ligase [Dermatophilaceae bacterium]
MTPADLLIRPLRGLPEIADNDDLAGLLLDAVERGGDRLKDGDVLVVTSKVVSKADGLRADPTHRAAHVLAQARRVVAERLTATGVIRITRTIAGPVLAGSGIDASNTGPSGQLLLLPSDPDGSAARLRDALLEAAAARGMTAPDRFGLIISDTSGRAWREGVVDFALGAAGLPVIDDLRGSADDDARPLTVTVRAVADELACAADLVTGKAERAPAALVRGWRWPPDDASAADAVSRGASALVRDDAQDWFAVGHHEAVRAALGVRAGTHDALDVGLRPVGTEELADRVERAVALARHDGLGRLPDGHPHARLAGPRPDPADARVDVIQHGVRVEAPDDVTLGVVTARLLVALAGEDVPSALARTWPRSDVAQACSLVLFLEDAAP